MFCYCNENIFSFVCNIYWFQFLTHQSANPTYIRTFHCGPKDSECDFPVLVVVQVLTLKIFLWFYYPWWLGPEVLSTEMPSMNR